MRQESEKTVRKVSVTDAVRSVMRKNREARYDVNLLWSETEKILGFAPNCGTVDRLRRQWRKNF